MPDRLVPARERRFERPLLVAAVASARGRAGARRRQRTRATRARAARRTPRRARRASRTLRRASARSGLPGSNKCTCDVAPRGRRDRRSSRRSRRGFEARDDTGPLARSQPCANASKPSASTSSTFERRCASPPARDVEVVRANADGHGARPSTSVAPKRCFVHRERDAADLGDAARRPSLARRRVEEVHRGRAEERRRRTRRAGARRPRAARPSAPPRRRSGPTACRRASSPRLDRA